MIWRKICKYACHERHPISTFLKFCYICVDTGIYYERYAHYELTKDVKTFVRIQIYKYKYKFATVWKSTSVQNMNTHVHTVSCTPKGTQRQKLYSCHTLSVSGIYISQSGNYYNCFCLFSPGFALSLSYYINI